MNVTSDKNPCRVQIIIFVMQTKSRKFCLQTLQGQMPLKSLRDEL